MFKVRSKYLLLIAAAVWLIAGSQVARVHTGCAVNFTPSAWATFMTVSNRGLAPGARAL